uniref:Uncharacterized protein n=1 Tax=Opuntia streptacantha TaxID=393608 RepID=A0A7C9DVQ5_OPUST
MRCIHVHLYPVVDVYIFICFIQNFLLQKLLNDIFHGYHTNSHLIRWEFRKWSILNIQDTKRATFMSFEGGHTRNFLHLFSTIILHQKRTGIFHLLLQACTATICGSSFCLIQILVNHSNMTVALLKLIEDIIQRHILRNPGDFSYDHFS